jgi:hypothetical protein
MKILSHILLVIIAMAFAPTWASASQVSSGTQNMAEVEVTTLPFIKKRYSIDGTAQILKTNTGIDIEFSEDFKTKGGPDLKIYLSKKNLSELSNESVDGSSLKIGVLKSKKGAQSYTLPENISLSDYKSVIIHCEAFSVLWGGFDLP